MQQSGQPIEQPGHQGVEGVVHFTCVARVRLTGHVAKLLAVKHVQVTCQRTEEGVSVGVVGWKQGTGKQRAGNWNHHEEQHDARLDETARQLPLTCT